MAFGERLAILGIVLRNDSPRAYQSSRQLVAMYPLLKRQATEIFIVVEMVMAVHLHGFGYARADEVNDAAATTCQLKISFGSVHGSRKITVSFIGKRRATWQAEKNHVGGSSTLRHVVRAQAKGCGFDVGNHFARGCAGAGHIEVVQD